MTAAPPDDRDLAAATEDLEQRRDLAGAEPAMRSALHRGPVLELAREERPALLELAQHVPSEARVRLQELTGTPLPVGAPAAASHPRA